MFTFFVVQNDLKQMETYQRFAGGFYSLNSKNEKGRDL